MGGEQSAMTVRSANCCQGLKLQLKTKQNQNVQVVTSHLTVFFFLLTCRQTKASQPKGFIFTSLNPLCSQERLSIVLRCHPSLAAIKSLRDDDSMEPRLEHGAIDFPHREKMDLFFLLPFSFHVWFPLG